LESRRGHTGALPPHDPSMPGLTEGQLDSHLSTLRTVVQDAISQSMKGVTATLLAKATGPARRVGELQDGALPIRESELRELLANKTVELQAVRAHVEADRYRLQTQVQDQEKRIAVRELEIQRLQILMRDLLADRSAGIDAEVKRARVSWDAEAASAELTQRLAEISALKVRLTEVERECAELKHDMASSVALRVARSLGWILRPIRAIFSGASSKGA